MIRPMSSLTIDDGDIQRIADAVLSLDDGTKSDDELLDMAMLFASFDASYATDEWRQEFKRVAKRRVEFVLMAKRRHLPSQGAL